MSSQNWFKIARSHSVVSRALLYTVVVGPILCIINQFDVFLNGQIDILSITKMGLTFLVPYFVSTFSSVEAILKMETKATDD